MGLPGMPRADWAGLAERAVVALETIATNLGEIEEVPEFSQELERNSFAVQLGCFTGASQAIRDILNSDTDTFKKSAKLRALSDKWANDADKMQSKLDAMRK
jgi:hypothetical protein